MTSLVAGRCFFLAHRGVDERHPDAWVRRDPDAVALETAAFTHRATLAGDDVLVFDDALGRRWAQPLRARPWNDPGEPGPSNRDAGQEREHGEGREGA